MNFFQNLGLSTRIGRRILSLFFLITFIPMCSVIALSFYQLDKMIISHTEESLRRASKDFALSIYERIRIAEFQLQEIADQIQVDDMPSFVGMEHWFDGLLLYNNITQDTTTTGKFPTSRFLIKHSNSQSRQSQAIIDTLKTAGQAHEIFISVMRPDANGSYTNLIAAKLNPKFIWRQEELDYRHTTCVFSNSQIELFCFDPSNNSADDIYATNNDSKIADRTNKYLQSKWTLSLRPYSSALWDVVLRVDKSQALNQLVFYKKTYVPLTILLIFVVLYIGIRHAQYTLRPLISLRNATTQILKNNYSYKINHKSNDEFGELSASMNKMTNQIGCHITFTNYLGDLDSFIHTKPALEMTIKKSLQIIQYISKLSQISITLVDSDNMGENRLFELDQNQELTIQHRDVDSTLLNGLSEIVEKRLNTSNSSVYYDVKKVEQSVQLEGKSANSAATNLKDTDITGQQNGKDTNNFFYLFPLAPQDTVSGFCEITGHLSSIQLKHILLILDRVSIALNVARQDERLYYQAHHDLLTGVANRQLFNSYLQQEIAHASRDNANLAVLFVDLDHFKKINDALGHVGGDELLRNVSKRMQSCLRSGDVLSRNGGDEFTVLLPNVGQPREIANLANRIIVELKKPFSIYKQEFYITASIGVSLYPRDGVNAQSLIRSADLAMYKAKEKGRNCVMFFEKEMDEFVKSRLRLEADLRHVIEKDQLFLTFQPQVNIMTGEVMGAEVLLRWRHPAHGLIPPDVFISVAEDSGQIIKIGNWVLFQACETFRKWIDDGYDLPKIAINLSVPQFRDPQFVEHVKFCIDRFNIPKGQLVIEITENIYAENKGVIIESMKSLRQLGVLISIDDFGTGYSSLAYLKSFPFDSFKIDKSFFDDLNNNEESASIIEAIYTLGRSMHKEVVSEGIETIEQVEFLQKCQAQCVQGYYFSKPIPADEFERYMSVRNKVIVQNTAIELNK